jgi:hypothetical protein
MHHAIKMPGEVGVKLHKFVMLTINGQRRPASPSGRYTQRKRNSVAYWNWLQVARSSIQPSLNPELQEVT